MIVCPAGFQRATMLTVCWQRFDHLFCRVLFVSTAPCETVQHSSKAIHSVHLSTLRWVFFIIISRSCSTRQSQRSIESIWLPDPPMTLDFFNTICFVLFFFFIHYSSLKSIATFLKSNKSKSLNHDTINSVWFHLTNIRPECYRSFIYVLHCLIHIINSHLVEHLFRIELTRNDSLVCSCGVGNISNFQYLKLC